MKKCQDCKYWGSCNKTGDVCETYEKMHRTITKLDEVDNGYYKFSKLEVEDDL